MKVNKIQTEKNKDKTLRQDTESCILADCSLCPRNCHVDRTAGKTGYCGMDQKVKIARAALHMWEEPCISGTRGSGAVEEREKIPLLSEKEWKKYRRSKKNGIKMRK